MADFQVVNALDREIWGAGGDPGKVRALLLTHLRTSGKVDLYFGALRKFVVGGRLVFSATWSWWAFFGGAFYFFYRRMTLPGLILLGLTVLLWFVPIPMAGFLVSVGCALSAKYLYCKKFIGDLEAAGYPSRTPDETRHTLARLGGYNGWAIWLGVIARAVGLLISAALILFGFFSFIPFGFPAFLTGVTSVIGLLMELLID